MSCLSEWLGSVDGTPPFAAGHVVLTPLTSEEDLRFLYALYCDPEAGEGWRFDGIEPTYEVFLEDLARPVHCRMIVRDRATHHRLGLVLSDWADLRSGVASASVAVSPEAMHTGVGLLAFAMFANYLFCTWPLRKLRMTAPSYALSRYAHALGPVLSDEGVLRDHRYHNGRYWDEHVLSMSPDQLMGLAVVLPPVRSNRSGGPSNPVLMLPSHDVFLQRVRSALWDDRPDRLEMDTQLSGLALDSLDIVSLALSVEELIGQQIESGVILSWKTPTDIYEYAISCLVGSHSLEEAP